MTEHLFNSEDIGFSVIMATYNRAFIIKKAIDSLINQKYKNWELLIIDDGSVDNTENIVKDNYKEFFDAGKFIYIKKQHEGLSATRNFGISKANNQYIVHLDTDNELLPDFLEEYAAAIREKPQTNCFYSKFIKSNNKIVGKKFNYYELCTNNLFDIGVFVYDKNLAKSRGEFDVNIKTLDDWDVILRYTYKNPPLFINKLLMKYYSGKDFERISTKEDPVKAKKLIQVKIDNMISKEKFFYTRLIAI